jgi:hypothetical protein
MEVFLSFCAPTPKKKKKKEERKKKIKQGKGKSTKLISHTSKFA